MVGNVVPHFCNRRPALAKEICSAARRKARKKRIVTGGGD